MVTLKDLVLRIQGKNLYKPEGPLPQFLEIFDEKFSNEVIIEQYLDSSLLSTIELEKCTFKAINFDGSNFLNCNFLNCIFQDVTFRKSEFSNCNFNNCQFINCKISKSEFFDCSFTKCEFFKNDLTFSYFAQCKLVESKFKENDLMAICIDKSSKYWDLNTNSWVSIELYSDLDYQKFFENIN